MNGFSLQNLSVPHKLGLGFGLLLAFALLLALTGLYGLHGSSESLSRINRLGTLFDEMVFTREANFNYALNTDASLLDTHREHLQSIDEILTAMIADARNDTWPVSDLGPLLGLQAQLEGYRMARNQAANADAVVAANQLLAKLQDDANKLYLAEETRATGLVARSDFWLATLTLTTLLFGALAALGISRQIVLPLRHAVAAAKRIANGDLTEELHSLRRDELGALLCSLHTMNSSLRTVISQIGSGAHQIAASASQLAVSTTQTQTGIDYQRGDTDSVASAMNQMTATVQEVARHSAQTAKAAREVDKEVSDAHELSQTTIVRIEALAAEISVSAESMGRLKQESDRISGIRNVIKEVTDQTNLLALNAVIEAAHAGEAGRGFAVVADEVRNLAQRTQQASGEIEQLIVELQHIADEASRAMQSSVEQTQTSVVGVRDTGAALEIITRQVADIQQMSELIASATDQQATVAEEINRSVVRVRGTAEKSATASAEISAASSELELLGRDLDALAGHFRT